MFIIFIGVYFFAFYPIIMRIIAKKFLLTVFIIHDIIAFGEHL